LQRGNPADPIPAWCGDGKPHTPAHPGVWLEVMLIQLIRAALKAAQRASARPALALLASSALLAATGCDMDPKVTRIGGQPSGTAARAPAPAPTAKGTATLRWAAPTQTSAGDPLTDLAGYRVHYGQMTVRLDRKVTIDGPGTTAAVVSDLGSGTWFFAVTAFTRAGVESSMSNVVSKYIP